jgi:hypothetical protein
MFQQVLTFVDSDAADQIIDRVMMVTVPTVCAMSVGYGCGVWYGVALAGIAAATIGAIHGPFSTKRVGGLRFVKVWRLTLSFSVSRQYRPF